MKLSVCLLALCATITAPLSGETPKAIYVDFGGVIAQSDPKTQLDYLVGIGIPKEAIENSPYFRWMQLHPEEIEYLSKVASEKSVEIDWEEYKKVKRDSVVEID